MKRSIGVLALVGVLLLLSPRAAASERGGSLEIRLDAGELPVTNGAVTLYLVGVPTEDGYRLLDRYGGGIIRRQDVTSGHLAGWLRELAGSGRELLLDVDGRAVFSDVQEGLYLLEQTERMDGFYPFRGYLVEMPSDGQWNLKETPGVLPIMVESPKTGDLGTWLAVLSLLLSGTGLTLCAIAGKLGKRKMKKR